MIESNISFHFLWDLISNTVKALRITDLKESSLDEKSKVTEGHMTASSHGEYCAMGRRGGLAGRREEQGMGRQRGNSAQKSDWDRNATNWCPPSSYSQSFTVHPIRTHSWTQPRKAERGPGSLDPLQWDPSDALWCVWRSTNTYTRQPFRDKFSGENIFSLRCFKEVNGRKKVKSN